MFHKLREQLKVMFEGDRCRFRKECGHYRLDAVTCNNEGSSHCGKYRELENG